MSWWSSLAHRLQLLQHLLVYDWLCGTCFGGSGCDFGEVRRVFEAGQLKAGETLLVHGATSGIGVTAIQMAKAAGARVIATARGAGKAGTALSFGADIAIYTTTEDFVQKALDLAGDVGRRKTMRTKIIERRHVLFRDTAPVVALERCLMDAVARSRAKSSS